MTNNLKNMTDLFVKWGKRENHKVEFKQSQLRLSNDIWETISAFANTKGGLILLGYKEDNNKFMPVGLSNPEKIIEDLSSTIGEKMNYCPIIQIEIRKDKGIEVVAVEVNEAPKYQKPIYIKKLGPLNGGFKRIGSSDIKLTDADIQRFYTEREGTLDSHEILTTALKDIDFNSIKIYKNVRITVKPTAPELKMTDLELLNSYRLFTEKEKLTLAGLLLFGEKQAIQKNHPSARLDIIRISGTEWGKDKDTFLSHDIQNNLINTWFEALDNLERFFMIPFKLKGNILRDQNTALQKAIKEALTNLLMHQDYFRNVPAQIIIYNDRVEFHNPGHSLKMPEYFEMPGSELRNPLIASVFYDLGWAETKGSGIKTIIDEMSTAGYQKPEIISDQANDSFIFTIYPNPIIDQIKDLKEVHHDFRDRVAKVLSFCQKPRSLKEIMKMLDLKDRANFRKLILNPLMKKGYIERTIPHKPSSRYQKYYTIKE